HIVRADRDALGLPLAAAAIDDRRVRGRRRSAALTGTVRVLGGDTSLGRVERGTLAAVGGGVGVGGVGSHRHMRPTTIACPLVTAEQLPWLQLPVVHWSPFRHAAPTGRRGTQLLVTGPGVVEYSQ